MEEITVRVQCELQTSTVKCGSFTSAGGQCETTLNVIRLFPERAQV